MAVTVTRLRTLTPIIDLDTRDGYKYLGADVKVCVVENRGEDINVSTSPWSISFTDDTTVAASYMSEGIFDVPMYPLDRLVRPGRCVRGWIAFEVPTASKPAILLYQPSGSEALEWSVR
jgi:hypothetical protein